MKPKNKSSQQLAEFAISPEPVAAPVSSHNGMLPNGESDKEGAMAKADLFKLSNYSYRLFKKLEDDQQLESWVQAKITKAADYIASVFHYLEYEMKFSEYGHKLDNSDVLSESQKSELKNKLMEARANIKALKLAQAKKMDEAASPKADKDYDGDGKVESDKDEVIGSRRKAAGLDKKEAELDESTKPSADLTKKEKTSVVKKAKKGGDIGKPGKNFEKVADKAAKKYGSKEKGEKVAAAAMWKNIKEGVSKKLKESHEMNFGEGVYEEGNEVEEDMLSKKPEVNLNKGKEKQPFKIEDASEENIEVSTEEPAQINESVELTTIKMLSGL